MAKKPLKINKPEPKIDSLKPEVDPDAPLTIPEMKFPNKREAKPPSIKDMKNAAVVPNPLKDVEYQDDLEADTEAEFSAVLEGFAQRQKQEDDRFRLAVDTEFWFAVCFESADQKEQFLRAMGWFLHGGKYIDGLWLCEQYGIQIERPHLANKKTRKDKKWRRLAETNGVVGLTEDGSVSNVAFDAYSDDD